MLFIKHFVLWIAFLVNLFKFFFSLPVEHLLLLLLLSYLTVCLCLLNGELILNGMVWNAAGFLCRMKEKRKTSVAFYWMTKLLFFVFCSGKQTPHRKILEIFYFLEEKKEFANVGRQIFQVNHVKTPWIFQKKRMDKVTSWAQSWYSWKNDKMSMSPFFLFFIPWNVLLRVSFWIVVSPVIFCLLCLMSHQLVGYLLSYLECWVLIVDWALFYVRIVQFLFLWLFVIPRWCKQMTECARNLSLVTNIWILFVSFSSFFSSIVREFENLLW